MSAREKILTYNLDIYKNGLKFDRDRKFRNKLIITAICSMTVLLIVATLVCVSLARFYLIRTTTVTNKTTYLSGRKLPFNNYDPDSAESVKDPEILQGVKTKFVPTFQQLNARYLVRLQRDASEQDNSRNTDGEKSEILNQEERADVVDLDEEEVVWTKVDGGRIQRTSKSQLISERKDDNTQPRRHQLDMFWNDQQDRNSVRNTQAQKMLSFMDLTSDPCNDFYQYACGNWSNNNPIPEDKASFDTFEMLRESLDVVLRDLLQEPVTQNEDGVEGAVNKAKKFFASCMNEETLEKRGNQPLLDLANELGGWPIIDPTWNASRFDWVALMARLRLYNNDVLLSQWVGPDIKDSDRYIVQFDQTSLGLPTRDYYLLSSNSAYLDAYKKYIIDIAVLLGADKANVTGEAQDLIEFETNLARIMASPEERRNVTEMYTRMTVDELNTRVPDMKWLQYLEIVLARPVQMNESVVLFALKYVDELVKLVNSVPARTVSNYLMFRFMRHRSNNLDGKFQAAKQDFYYVVIGREKAPPRWNSCVNHVNTNMGMALGAMFVRRYFDENSKKDTLSMTEDIMMSFREMLNSTEWIDDETKSLAQDKVDAMILRIGYPDFILDTKSLNERYLNVTVIPEQYFENTLRLLSHLASEEQNRLGTIVNKTQWNTPPAVVNAYYSRNKNQIMFPAGILQPPFYHKHFPRSLNYGGIGVVIGHEVTHGFDDKGRLFDRNGNLHRWWKEEAVNRFHQRAQCLVDQYSSYTLREVDIKIDGVNTQGENIADNGGIKQAFRAYERWLTKHNGTEETLPGVNATSLQLFFLNFAQVWCGSMRPEAVKVKVKVGYHSPARFRVIGTLSNSEEFARVFKCPPSTTMNPPNKCSVW